MATRWFVFWIACWIVTEIKSYEYSLIFLVLAALTTAPDIKSAIKEHIDKK
jgi:hypothetical protein